MTIPLQIRAKLTKSQEIAQPTGIETELKFEDKFPATFNNFKPVTFGPYSVLIPLITCLSPYL